MTEAFADELKQAVETQHGGTATFVQAVPVHETHNGETVWDGVVHVFELKHSTSGAFRANTLGDPTKIDKHLARDVATLSRFGL
jgi:hypothetical protein